MSSTIFPPAEKRKRLFVGTGVSVFILLITLGIFASNGWFPHTDSFSGKKTGWFGKELAKNASSSWNPYAAPLPTPTPQLSKEYIYAGSRLLAVEDANANAAPPADLAIWRPSDGNWWVMGGQGSQQVVQPWGGNGDIPVPGDYDGDGKTDFAIFRPLGGTWWILRSSDGSYYSFPLGQNGDKPAVADFDGDGKTDAAIVRSNDPSAGLVTWYILKSSDSSWYSFPFGVTTDIPSPADYDGDGRADIAVWRDANHTFYSINSSNGATPSYAFGSSNSVPVSADYDGDGKANFAIRTGTSWIILNATGTSVSPTTPSGDQSTDLPVQNDYDADGKVDIAVWRPSTGNWFIRQSGNSQTRTEQWGGPGDIPVPALYRR